MSATQMRTALLQNLSPFLNDVQAMQQINAFVVHLSMPTMDTITPELRTRIEASRKDIKKGRGKDCRTKAELTSFLAAL